MNAFIFVFFFLDVTRVFTLTYCVNFHLQRSVHSSLSLNKHFSWLKGEDDVIIQLRDRGGVILSVTSSHSSSLLVIS